MRRATRPWLLWCFAAVLASGFASLGVWQLGRRAEKAQMLRDAGAALAERNPQPLSVLDDAGRARAYDWITVSGRFADAPPVLLDNQQRDGRVGVRAYRLFLVEGASPVLVELGWLSLPPDRRLPTVPVPPAQRFAGLLLPPPGQGLRLAPPAP
jgi:cytochrome oxidase assembly protein ShyY1